MEQRTTEMGFTLTELLIGMAIGLILMAGLVTSYIHQSRAYSYNSHRADAVENLAYAMDYMYDDMRSSLYSMARDPSARVTIVNGATDTVAVSFKVWDRSRADNVKRSLHCYLYRNRTIYMRKGMTGACNATTPLRGFAALMENVTHFHVWKDVPGRQPMVGTTVPLDAPLGLPFGRVYDDQGGVFARLPGYTVLIETVIDERRAKHGSRVDALGTPVGQTGDPRPRIRRYFQVYPGTVIR